MAAADKVLVLGQFSLHARYGGDGESGVHNGDEMKRLAATRRGSLRSTNKSVRPVCRRALSKEQPAMVYGAIDLHLRYSWIRVVDAEGRVLREQRVVTTRERLTASFEGWGPMRILLETGTESEWVAQTLEQAGHRGDRGRSELRADVWGDPAAGENGPTGRGRAGGSNRRGWYRPAHRRSAGQRAMQQILRTRRQLVWSRSGHDFGDPRGGAARGLSAAVGQQRAGARAAGPAGGARGPDRDARATGPDGVEHLTTEIAGD